MIPRPQISRAALGPILLVSLLVLLIAGMQPPARPRIAPPSAVDMSLMFSAEHNRAPGVPTPTIQPLVGDFAQRSELDIISADGLFSSSDQARLAGELERALNYVSTRFGNSPQGRISVYLGWATGCGLNGIAYTEKRVVQVFTCPELPRSRAVNILAHEFVHQLAHDRYGPAHLRTDLILLEGVATWGAGEYWLGGQPSFAAFVRQYQQAGNLLPLATSYVGRSIADMNMLYYQWASFVDFLISSYGREKFDALYVTGDSAPGSADYVGIYGKSLDLLEQEWLIWLTQTP